ncbi:MAG: heme exporter protein CcmD [Gammaproteobacteria bacterium]
MGGYAYYVWVSYSSVFLFLIWTAFKPMTRR